MKKRAVYFIVGGVCLLVLAALLINYNNISANSVSGSGYGPGESGTKEVKYLADFYPNSKSCSDSDDGAVSQVAGNVTTRSFFRNYVYKDFCRTSKTRVDLVEYFCEKNKVKSKIVACENGCNLETGACNPRKITIDMTAEEDPFAADGKGALIDTIFNSHPTDVIELKYLNPDTGEAQTTTFSVKSSLGSQIAQYFNSQGGAGTLSNSANSAGPNFLDPSLFDIGCWSFTLDGGSPFPGDDGIDNVPDEPMEKYSCDELHINPSRALYSPLVYAEINLDQPKSQSFQFLDEWGHVGKAIKLFGLGGCVNFENRAIKEVEFCPKWSNGFKDLDDDVYFDGNPLERNYEGWDNLRPEGADYGVISILFKF